MILLDELKQLVIRCIGRDITVQSFREQFVRLYLSIDRQSDSETKNLADSIDNLYADVLIGASNEDEFVRKLAQFTPIVVASLEFEWALAPTSSNPQPSGSGLMNPLQSYTEADLLQPA